MTANTFDALTAARDLEDAGIKPACAPPAAPSGARPPRQGPATGGGAGGALPGHEERSI